MTTEQTTPVRQRAKRRPNGAGRAPKRTVRVPDDEWQETDAIAAARGDTVGAAIRWGLEEYRRRFGDT
jgi:hypothetical protein